MRVCVGALVVGLAVSPFSVHAQQCVSRTGGWGFGPATDIVARGSMAVVATGTRALVIDRSDPTILRTVAELELGGPVKSVDLSDGGLAIAAASVGGLWLINMASPDPPLKLRVPGVGSAEAVAILGTHGYAVFQHFEGDSAELTFVVIDLADPVAPHVVASTTSLGEVDDIDAADGMVYIATADGRLLMVDVSNPLAPVVETFDPPREPNYGLPVRVAACGDAVYLAVNFNSWIEPYVDLHAIDSHQPQLLWTSSGMARYYDLECAGDHRLGVTGVNGISVLDVSTSTPEYVGGRDFREEDVEELELIDGYALVGARESGLVTADLSNLDPGTGVGSLEVPGFWYRPAVSGGYLFGASLDAGLTVVDIADPGRPRVVWSRPDFAPGSAIAVRGERALVAAGDDHVTVVDISNPAAPVVVTTFAAEGRADWADFVDDYAVIVSDKIQIFDISDPSAVTEVGSLPLRAVPAVDGERLVLASPDGLWVADVSTPSNSTIVGRLETDWSSSQGYFPSLSVVGDRVYVASVSSTSSGALHTIDISDPRTPIELGSIAIEGRPTSVLVAGDALLVLAVSTPSAGWDLGSILVYDPSDPMRPVLTSVRDMSWSSGTGWSGGAASIGGVVDDDHLYLSVFVGLAGDDAGLQVLDLSVPDQPRSPGTLDTPGSTFDVAAGDGLAISAEDIDQLRVFDSSDPRRLRPLASVDLQSQPYRMIVGDGAVYLPMGWRLMRVLDLSNPSEPFDAAVSVSAWGLSLDGDTLLAATQLGLEVLDVTTPTQPVVIGGYFVSRGAGANVATVGDHAVLLSRVETETWSDTDVTVLDMSDPTAPTKIGELSLVGGSGEIAVAGQYLLAVWYPSSDEQRLRVIDLADPTQPAEVALLDVADTINDVIVTGNLALVAGGTDGVLVLDIANPAAPVELGWLATGGDAENLAVSGRWVLVANGNGGVMTLDLQQCWLAEPGWEVAFDD